MKQKGLVSGVLWLTKPVGDAEINWQLQKVES
jgi:hypothetical protein